MPFSTSRKPCNQESGKKGNFVVTIKETGTEICFESEGHFKKALVAMLEKMADHVVEDETLEEEWTAQSVAQEFAPPGGWCESARYGQGLSTLLEDIMGYKRTDHKMHRLQESYESLLDRELKLLLCRIL